MFRAHQRDEPERPWRRRMVDSPAPNSCAWMTYRPTFVALTRPSRLRAPGGAVLGDCPDLRPRKIWDLRIVSATWNRRGRIRLRRAQRFRESRKTFS